MAHLIIVSDRGPVTFRPVQGRLTAERRSGSVVRLVDRSIREINDATWVATSTSTADVAARESGDLARTSCELGYRYEPVFVDKAAYDSYYNGAGARMLWPAHHDLWAAPLWGKTESSADLWIECYQRVNRDIASFVARVCGDRSLVIFEDYQLSTAPGWLRRIRHRPLIAHFMHTPFASVTSLRHLPKTISVAVLEGMLQADLLGFQTSAWAQRFMRCCAAIGARVDWHSGLVVYNGRRSWVRCYPVIIDAAAVLSRSCSSHSLGWRSRLASGPGRLIVRVDRLDPAKNSVRGFAALRLLLEREPRLRGQLRFIACLVPSRPDVVEYKEYSKQMFSVVREINGRFPGSIEIYFGENYDRALAALSIYDVLLVNSLMDGMNLVAQEGPVANVGDGAVVLSGGAGCMDLYESGPFVLDEPGSVEATADALFLALNASHAERRARAVSMREKIWARDPTDWLATQIADMEGIRADGRPVTAASMPGYENGRESR